MKKVVVLNNKGGVSKTTTATSLASILSQEPLNRVLLIDGDAQGNTLIAYGKNPVGVYNTLYDVLLGDVEVADTVIEVNERLDILPSNSDMDYLDQDVWSDRNKYPFPHLLLRRALEGLSDSYTHVIIDSPPSMNLLNQNVLNYVNSIIIPFELEETALKGIVNIVGKVQEVKNNSLSIDALLPVKVESRTNLHQTIYNEVKEYADSRGLFLYRGIPKTVKFAESVTKHGSPAVIEFKSNRAVKRYYEFTNQLIERNVL